jgi:amino acid adenylation domain-containing protein
METSDTGAGQRGVSTLRARAPRSTRSMGAPLAGTVARVLDRLLRPVAQGGVGELYVAGGQLARGYLDDPAATASRYVADPYGPSGSRMYRTGDLVRWSEAEGLVFLGRTDAQVKVRGFRVDLAEIETDLRQVDGVVEAYGVIVDGTLHGVVTTGRAGLTGGTIRETLRERVPAYRVPTSVVVVERIPLTARGKVDRRRLESLVGSTAASDHVVPPEAHDPRLEILLGVFADVLGRDDVGPDSDFFDAGGHSLTALRLVGRANDALGAGLTARDVFGAGTPRELLRRLDAREPTVPALAGERRGPDAETDGPEAAVPDGALTPTQLGMWYLERTLGNGSLYTVSVALRLTGDVDRDALQGAVRDLVGRHPALRTVFPEDSGRPVRRELSPSAPEVGAASTLHVRECPAESVDRVAREFALERVDISQAPPFGASLVTAGSSGVLVLRTHHIVCDGWSAQVMAHDLGEAYSARREGAAPDWAGTVLRRAAPSGDQAETSAAEEYWSGVLSGAPQELPLPVDRARPAQATFAGFSRRHLLDEARTRALHALADRARTTPFAVLHALTATTLHRLGAGEDIVVGTPVAGREGAADAGVVDLFASTVVLRSRVDATSRFDEVLDRSRDAVRGALAHQGVPFERVVELLRPRRSVSAHPVFQVLLALDDTPRRPARWDGLEAEPVTGESAHARFDLSIYVEQTTRGDEALYDVRIECAADLFDPPAADLVWTTFTAVLDAVSHDPALRVGDVDVVPADALGGLLATEQGVRRTDRAPCTVHGLVLGAAASFPEQTALVDGTGPVGYAELVEWVDEVARRLVDAGVRPGDRVAVALPRSADMIAALLGTMASGAAYVPLDLSYPADRIGFLVEDSDPAAVLVPAGEQPPPATSVPVVTVPARPEPGARRTGRVDDVRRRSAPQGSSAYVLYTSGTTGRPKGVVVSHAAAVNQLRWMQELIPLVPGERVLQKTPTGFDVSVTEIFWPLSVGATLVVVRPDGHGDPVHLDRTVDEHGASTAFYVPSMLSEHLATVPRPLGPVRRLVVTGEAVQPALVESVHARTGATFVNGYGPTEVAVHATSWTAERGERVPSRVPIGAPLRNVVAHVLDDRLRRVPLGVTGELYLAGVQLADGYHRRPGLTGQRFVANPYGAPGERMYRTGDLVRRRHDGVLEFFGRRDGQVKVRGVRVELGEIEHALLDQADVQEAVVVLQGVDEDRPRLVAHVVVGPPRAGRGTGQELRRALGDVLPPALVPDRVEVHARLPRLPNGKVDRGALPEVSLAGEAVRRAPATELERLVHSAVVGAVGHDELGMDDRFFDVGGDSIRSIAVVAAMRQSGYELALRAFYDPGTLAALVEGAVPVVDGADPAGPDDDWDVSELVGLTEDERDVVARAAASRAGEGRDG